MGSFGQSRGKIYRSTRTTDEWPFSVAHHAFLVEIGKRAGGVVFRFESAVGFATVLVPKDLGFVIALGIERFDSAKTHYFGFDQAVEVTVVVRLVTPSDIPETEVDVEL